MILANFNDPRYVLPGDTLFLDGSSSVSNSPIESFQWSIRTLADAVEWSGTGPTVKADPISGTPADPFYRAIWLQVSNEAGETHLTKRRIEVANWPDSTTTTVHVPEPVFPSVLTPRSRPLIKIPPFRLESDASDFYVTPGSNFKLSFQDGTGKSWGLGFQRVPQGLLILTNPVSSTQDYYDVATSSSVAHPINPVSRNAPETTYRTENISLIQEEVWFDGTGWEVDVVRVDGEEVNYRLIQLNEVGSKTNLRLSPSMFSTYNRNVAVSVRLKKVVYDSRTPILKDREFSKTGTLELVYMPGSKFQKIWTVPTFRVARAIGYERGSKYYLQTDEGAYFRTEPVQEIFTQ